MDLEFVEGIPDDQLRALSGLIRNGFGIQEDVEAIYSIRGGGACDARHMVAKVTNGDIYGLKSSTRIANALEREKLISDLAIILKAPNASQTIQIPSLTLGVFNNDKVNITMWLREAKKISEVPQNELQENSKDFFQQYGEWVIFALCFGVADRHMGNWVWNTETKRLLMIDTEESFVTAGLRVSRFREGIERASKEPAKFKTEPDTFEDSQCLINGLQKMREKLNQRQKQVNELINGHEFAKNFQSPYFSMPVQEIFDELVGV